MLCGREGNRRSGGSPYAIGPLSVCLSVLSSLSMTLVYCFQTVGWIKMKHGTEVGLAHHHIVLDENPTPPRKRGHSPPPIFGLWLLWPNGWVDQDSTWYGARPRPRRHCVRWGPSSPKGTYPLNFRSMSIVAKRSDILTTAEHLYSPFSGTTRVSRCQKKSSSEILWCKGK